MSTCSDLVFRTGPNPAASRLSPREYWNARAARFAGDGEGLAAVCSFGMPAFYNAYIHHLQHRALAPWLDAPDGSRFLEIGCGVGRWTRRLAANGHDVVGLDLSKTMIDEARRRAKQDDVASRCRFLVSDCSTFSLRARFDRILGVTVLQHVLEGQRFAAAIGCIADHLAPAGRAVLLEAAPSQLSSRCDSPVFTARSQDAYLEAFARAGLKCVAISAVDPAPFRMWFLPWFAHLPRPIAVAGMFAATAAGVPIDFSSAGWTRARSWHKVFVLEHTGSGGGSR